MFKLSDFKDKNFSKAVMELYNLTAFNKEQYPNYTAWFYGKCIPGILNGNRDVLFILDGFLVEGLAIIKNTNEEKKICTLFVDNDYRRNRIGSELIETSYKILGTEKPLITIPEKNIFQFKYFIDKYQWKDTGYVEGYHNPEISYN